MKVYERFHYPILMRSRYTIVESEGVYFLTATLVNWLPVIIGEAACSVIVESLRFWLQGGRGVK